MNKILVFCDESCHSILDGSDYMSIGSVSCPLAQYQNIKKKIREIKLKNNFGKRELKWSKVSIKYTSMYKEIIDYFFDSKSIAFNGLVLTKKIALIQQIHENPMIFNDMYYTLYRLLLLRTIISENSEYKVFLDRKDSNGKDKIENLCKAIQGDLGKSTSSYLASILEIDSQCNELIQLADFFCGFLTYYYRGFYGKETSDKCKNELCAYILKKINAINKSFLGSAKFRILKIAGVKDD